ncbi:Something about silencing protein 10 [Kluyveromyces marxianus]
MAKRTGKSVSKRSSGRENEEEDPYGLNEVDDFAKKREKVMLDDAGINEREASDSDDFSVDEEEEVLGMSDEESSDEDVEDEDEDEDEELDGEAAYKKVFGRKLEMDEIPEEREGGGMLDNDNAWGTSKSEYYGADDLDDEETAKEIEKEALRQQKKHLEDLQMDDYLEDEVEEEWVKEAKAFDMGQFQGQKDDKSSNQVSAKDILNMDDESKENFLTTSFPEYLPLSKEFSKLSPVLEELIAKQKTENNDSLQAKIVALSCYLGTISTYFAVFLHGLQNNEDFTTMKNHPVMERILECKEIWRQANELPEVDSAVYEQTSGVESNVSDIEELSEELLQEQDELDEEGSSDGSEDEAMEDSEEEEEEEEEEEDFDIELSDRTVIKNRKEDLPQDVDDFVEDEIADVDKQEKKTRKKTLRFYTSKIDQKANKKTERFKGDDDIPYKERLYERQQRLLEEARKRGLHDNKAADLNNEDYNSDDEKTAKNINEEAESEYYKSIKADRQRKKEARIQAHKEVTKAAKEGKLAELAENITEDGKRAINYQILKNKGLTPKRKKENRNSRVKKRKKYEKAQKKLKSVRAVYSGGQSGSYEGEKTGIKKNLTKSVKFKN